MFGKLLDTASLLKAKLAKDELDQALIEATNDDNWQASTTLLHEISCSAYNHQKWKKISDFVWDKLRNTKRWKKVLKALNIVEFLLKNGPEFAVDQLKREKEFFRTMESFQAYDDGMDRGASIRQRARIVVSLLDSEDMLQDERVRAKQIRERMSHLAGSSSFNNQNPQRPNNNAANKYQSFSSASYKASDDNSAFYNYGSGNYGDREENKHHRDDYFQHVSRKTQQPKREEKDINKVTQNEPVAKSSKIEPIVTLNLKNRTAEFRNGEQKPKYEHLAQKLSKHKDNITTIPIVPDLSYKKKNAQDLLIDTEAYFVEHKYHFEEPARLKEDKTHKEATNERNGTYEPAVVNTQATPAVINTQATPAVVNTQPTPAVVNTQPTPAVVNTQPTPAVAVTVPASIDFNGLLFLGIQPVQNANPAKDQKKIQSQPPTVVPPQPVQPQVSPLTTFTPSSYSSISSMAPLIPPSQPNPFAPTPPYNNFNFYAFPGYAQQPYYNAYPSPNLYPSILPSNNIYSGPSYPYNQYHQTQAYTQPTYFETSPATAYTYNHPQKSAPNNKLPNKQNEDEFGDFKNGGSFDIQKINWMSNQEKNLTDLTDFTIHTKDIPKTRVQKKKQFSNNIKIDPWAW